MVGDHAPLFKIIAEHERNFKYRIERGDMTDEEWDILQAKIVSLAERHGAKVLKLEKPGNENKRENNRGVSSSPQI